MLWGWYIGRLRGLWFLASFLWGTTIQIFWSISNELWHVLRRLKNLAALEMWAKNCDVRTYFWPLEGTLTVPSLLLNQCQSQNFFAWKSRHTTAGTSSQCTSGSLDGLRAQMPIRYTIPPSDKNIVFNWLFSIISNTNNSQCIFQPNKTLRHQWRSNVRLCNV